MVHRCWANVSFTPVFLVSNPPACNPDAKVHRPGWQRSAPVAAASVALACKALGVSRDFASICGCAELDSCRLAWKAYNLLSQMRRTSTARQVVTNSRPAAADEQTMAVIAAMGARNDELRANGRRAATQLELTYSAGGMVADLIERANREQVLVGTRPKTIAAAAAWLVGTKLGEINLSKRQASVRCGLSEGALRRAATQLEPLLGGIVVKTEVGQAPARGSPVVRLDTAQPTVEAEPPHTANRKPYDMPPSIKQSSIIASDAASTTMQDTVGIDIDMDALLGVDW